MSEDKIIMPFVIGYEKHEEKFHMLITYNYEKLSTMKDIIQYIHNLENNYLNEKLKFKIKDICDFSFDFTEKHFKTINMLGYENTDLINSKDRFNMWLYFINLLCNKNIIRFEPIFYFNCEFRSEGNC